MRGGVFYTPPPHQIGLTHMKTHTGETREKLHKCYQCEYAAHQAGNLRAHMKTHSGEKLHKCNKCDLAFLMVDKLRRHMKTHSGEKSFKCIQCEYSSSQMDALKIHRKLHIAREAIPSKYWQNKAK